MADNMTLLTEDNPDGLEPTLMAVRQLGLHLLLLYKPPPTVGKRGD
jgi:hypothetical protein